MQESAEIFALTSQFNALTTSAVIVAICGWAIGILTIFWWWSGADPSTDPLEYLFSRLKKLRAKATSIRKPELTG